MDANGNYHVSFNLINSAEDQPSPQVSVQAQVLDSSGNAIGSIASAAMIKPGTTVFGVADGANPLEVVVPTFSIKTIQQSTPVPSRNNTITVTLKANYDLPDTSTVTIKGLTGSITDDSANLNITSTDNRLGTTATWTSVYWHASAHSREWRAHRPDRMHCYVRLDKSSTITRVAGGQRDG